MELGWPFRVVLNGDKGPAIPRSLGLGLSRGEDRTLGGVPLCTRGQFPEREFLDSRAVCCQYASHWVGEGLSPARVSVRHAATVPESASVPGALEGNQHVLDRCQNKRIHYLLSVLHPRTVGPCLPCFSQGSMQSPTSHRYSIEVCRVND